MNTSCLEAAQHYASLGYRVMPCRPGAKTPATPHGLKDASDDPDQITAWWSEQPNANVAVATDPVLVVDLDPGSESWLSADHALSLAGAPQVQTPRGGRHYYLSPNGTAYRNTASKIAEHVDTRAAGGYALVPPSVVDGKAYEWTVPLDSPKELPPVPVWLSDALEAAEQPKAKPEAASTNGEAWTEKHRNDRLTSLAGSLRRAALEPEEIDAALQVANTRRCRPPLAASEVSKIARSMGRYEKGADADGDSGEIEFTGVSCAELAKGDYSVKFLIENTLCKGQPCLVGAAAKSLKTILCIDAAVSLATATPFLGHEWCDVPEAQKVVYMSGEGGLSIIQDYAARVAKSKGFDLGAVSGLTFCDRLPQLADLRHLDALRRFLTDHEATVAFLDPCYLCMPSDNSGNVMAQGSILRHVNNLCQDIGCTPVMIHHTKRATGREIYSVPELADLSWAGFAEFAGQWWAVGRREAYNGDSPGEHALWLHVGGRAGHSALHALDVHEGSLLDVDGRYWNVEVQRAGEVRKRAVIERDQRKEADRAAATQARIDADVRLLLDVLATKPDGLTKTSMREHTGIRSERIGPAIAHALRNDYIVPCEVPAVPPRKKPFSGYRLASNE